MFFGKCFKSTVSLSLAIYLVLYFSTRNILILE